MIKSIQRFFRPESTNVFYTIELDPESVVLEYARTKILDEIIEKLSNKYVEEYSCEILKSLNQKLIDHKVIQKVVEKLIKSKEN